MVERRLRRAIVHVGSFWYTAWVDAGRPALPDGDARRANALERMAERLSERWRQPGALPFGRPHAP
jgi:hypothetical protein